ncbi:MAG: hypothetical protein HN348_35635, partial [Proteobacteria bacterium]|nr:hypothetical protein [Pseudomonadota bacterium]
MTKSHFVVPVTLGLFLVSSSGCPTESTESPSPADTDEGFGFTCIQDVGEDLQLPSGYVSTSFYRTDLHGLSRVTRSTDGTVFVMHLNTDGGQRVSRLDVDLDTLTTVADFDDALPSGTIVGGPDDSFFMSLDTEVRQYKKDGTYAVWGTVTQGAPCFYSSDGKMYTTDFNEVYVAEPDGSYESVATGFSGDLDVVVDDDGLIFIADSVNGKLEKVDADGTQTTLADILPDLAHLYLDVKGDLYGTNLSGEHSFSKIDKTTGAFTAA